MKSFIGYLFICFFSIQITFGQTFRIDSSSILTIFGNTNGNLDFRKYTYDSQNRISQIASKFQIQNYVYQNEYDHSIETHNPLTNLFFTRVDNYYNDDGLIISQERHRHENQEYSLDKKKLFEYDLESRLVKELQYSYGQNGTEYLIYSYDFNYDDGKLVKKLQIYYVANEIYRTTTTDYIFLGDFLVEEQQQEVTDISETSYSKTIQYNGDSTMNSSMVHYLNGVDTILLENTEYIHTNHGIRTNLISYYPLSDLYEYRDSYRSYIESPFYELDTFINIIQLNTFDNSIERRFKSTNYSITGDSAFVRQEQIIDDSQFSEFLQIKKDIYVQFEGTSTEIIEKELTVANIYPNLASPNSTIIIQKVKPDVNRAELYNAHGQKVDQITLGSESQTLSIAPQHTGNYYMVYYADNKRIGQVGKLIVK